MGRKRQIASALIAGAILVGGLLLNGNKGDFVSRSGKQAVEQSFEKQVSEKKKELKEAKGYYCPDTIVLADTTKEQAESLAKKLGAKVRLTKRGDYATLYLPKGMTIEDVYENEEYEADLVSMTPDYTVSTMAVDALGHELMATRPQYNVTDTYYQSQGYLDYLNVQDSWNTSKGAGVKVAIIDTGIDTDNPEFTGRISQMSYNASDDKVVRDYGMEEIEDMDGHGTQVAGVLAAGMEGNGITGIAPEAELIVIKCETDGYGSFLRGSDLVFGLAYAIECDADVVNMSFGTQINVFQKYTKLAVDSDIICVAAAGNNGSGIPTYPAADENVIGVGAMTSDDWSLDTYSNFGDNSELIAPGTVYTTTIDNNYQFSMGTSLASPVTAGTIALYIAGHPHTEFKVVCRLLEASCIDLGSPGEDWYYGYGALDVCAFLCGQQGTITYEMQTDEVKNQTQTFVKGHSVQTMPEPERDNVVFDGWFFDPECTDECDYYTHIFTEDITLYANWINEDEGSAYIYVIKDDDTVEIRSYTGKRRYLTVPEKIEGRTVSSIGDSAFENNSRIRSVILPSTITKIGDRSFQYCSALRAIDIPDKVETIGINAFTGCVRLTSVGIAARGSLISIGDESFSMCSINTFNIPEKLKHLGIGAFLQSTGIHSVTVTEGNNYYQVKNDALYDISGETLLYYPAGLAGDYQVNPDTKKIGYAAFAFGQSRLVTLPQGLIEIGERAFYGSNGLQKIVIPARVATMGNFAFSLCYALSEIEFEKDSLLEKIPDGAFAFCARIGEITIPDEVVEIGQNAFGTSGLKNIHFSSGSKLKSLMNSAFTYSSLESIDIPDSVESIGPCCFSWSSLNSIVFSNRSQCCSIGETAFFNCLNLTEISLPDSLTYLGPCALYKTSINSIYIGTNLTEIEEGAFSYCQKLEEIRVSEGNTAYSSYEGLLYDSEKKIMMLCPAARKGTVILADSTQEIQGSAFAGTNQINKVVMNEGLKTIGGEAFLESGIQTPTLPSTLTTIGEEAFCECLNMTEMLAIPKGVISIGRFAVFKDINLRQIEIEAESTLSRIGYGAFAGCGIETFTVPENVSSMGQEIFAGCDNLTTVTFEGNNLLRNLAAWTFWGAENLRRITFEEGSRLQLIEAKACENMPNLDKVDLSGCSELKTIDNYAFKNCKKLDTILLPDNIEEIGRYAFFGCNNLSRIDLPESLTWIGRYAFNETKQMNVYFKASVLPANLETNWDKGISGYYLGVEDKITNGDWVYALTKDGRASVIAYQGSDEEIKLSTIDGYEVVSIGGSAFKGNNTLKSITLPETITGIYRGAFADTPALEQVNLPSNLEILDAEAFKNSGVSKVVIADDSKLKTIGKYAFAETKNLDTFTVPAGVQRISEYAFWRSGISNISIEEKSSLRELERFVFAESSLETINLPENLVTVGDSAFRETLNLRGIRFGTKEEINLGSHAFYGSGLETITLPANVIKIGELCFTTCNSLTNINVDQENEKYSSIDGVLFNKAVTTLITCPAGKTGSYNIQASVSRIAFAAFEGSRLSEINIPDDSKLNTIGYRAFFRCENLESIHIPPGVQSIENYSFAYDKALTNVEISSESQLSGIYKSAFYSCEKLSSISIPDSVQEIGDYAFYNCAALKQVHMGQNSCLKGVYDHAFEYSGISKFVMPQQMFELGDYAFHGSALQEFSFNTMVTDLGTLALANLDNLQTDEVIIPDTVEYIGRGLLEGDQSIRKITIPFVGAYQGDARNTFIYLFNTQLEYLQVEEVTVTMGSTIYMSAFSRMECLRKINLPDSITKIENSAFDGCINMEMYGLPSNIRIIEGYAFNGDNNVYIPELPETLESVSAMAFNGCKSAERLVIPAGTYSIDEGAFSGMVNLAAFEIDINNKYYSCVDGILYNYDKSVIISVPGNLSGEITIPNGVRRIGYAAFCGSKLITKVSIPDSVKEIAWDAFRECDGLEEVFLPDSNFSMGGACFFKCVSLKSFTLPRGVTEIDNQILYGCSGLKELYIEAKITDLKGMVDECSSLEHLELPEGMTFFSCVGLASLKELILPESIEIADIHRCTNLSYVYLGSSLKTIGGTFRDCNNLACVDISDANPYFKSVEGIVYSKDMKELVFAPRNKSGYVTIPDGVKKIGEYSFEECRNITGVKVPESVVEIGGGAFHYCTKLKDITLGNHIQEIGWDAFSGVGYLDIDNWDECWQDGAFYIGPYLVGSAGRISSTLVVKNGTKLIATNAFQGADIEYLYIPDSVQYINGVAFWRCKNLKYVSFGKGIRKISSRAFAQSGLKSVYLGSSIEEIGNGAFSECNQLKYVWIDNPNISYEWLFNDSLIETIRIPIVHGRNPGAQIKKMIVTNAGELDDIYFSTYLEVGEYYMDSTRDVSPIGEYDINDCKVLFRDDWHNVLYFAGNMLISLDAMQNDSVLQLPSAAEVKGAVPQATEIIGWDINGDGRADKMPATLTDDLVAVAVCDIPITGIEMEQDYQMEIGESYTLDTKCLPEGHTHSEEILFASSDESVLIVDEDGKITGVSEGSAIVTARLAEDTSIKAECTVTVIPTQFGIKLDEPYGYLNVGETKTLSPKFVFPEGYDEKVIWESSDTTIAEVSEGTIMAKAPGYVQINITCGEYSVTYSLEVLQPLDGITISKETFALTVGSTQTLNVGYLPENTTADRTVSWYTTQPAVAIVDDSGLVTAKGPGIAQIHAIVGDKDAYCTITVTAPIQSVFLNTTTGTMRLDRTKQLEMIFTPANTTDDKTVTWSSENPGVALVSNSGLVKAVSKGKTTITGTVGIGTEREMSASYTVTVIGLKDTKTGIIVANSDNTEMDESIVLSVDYINESENFDEVSERVRQAIGEYKMEDMQAYDISLMKDNTSVQPGTKVDVEIPVGEEMVSDDTVIYRLEEDGTLTDMDAGYEDGRYTFETEHFSVYVLGKKKPVKKVVNIQITPAQLIICPGKTANLYATVLPEDAANPSVDWYSSDERIATVSGTGTITAVSEGTVTITVISKDGSQVQATAEVIVGHSWNEGEVTKAPTCTEAGVRTYTCTECGQTRTEAIQALGHNYKATVTDPTCIEKGYTEHICERCGDSYIDSYTDALGHDWSEWEVVNAATETEEGLETRVCRNDPSHVETGIIPKLTHIHTMSRMEKQDATCTKEGNIEYYTCSGCGRFFLDEEGTNEINEEDTVIGKTPHTPGEVVRENETAAGCETAGSYETVVCCTACGEELSRKTDTVPATGHQYGQWAAKDDTTHQRVCEHDSSHVETAEHTWDAGEITADPTCTDPGVRTYTCTECGQTRMEAIQALGHDWGDWEVTKAASETEEGLETRACRNNPSHVETRIIPKLTHIHTMSRVEKRDATCTKGGNIEYYTCSECGRFFLDGEGKDEINVEDTVIGKTPHTPGEAVRENEKTAGCETAGSYETVVYCMVCGEELSRKTDAVPATGHQYGQWTAKDETTHQRICGHNSNHVETAEHTWNAGEITKAPTCTDPGVRTYTCTECGQTRTEKILALGHDWSDWEVTKAASETEEGLETRTCRNDSSHVETRIIPKLNHIHTMSRVEKQDATCTKEGNIEYYSCSGCGRFFLDGEGKDEINVEDTVIGKTPHKPGEAVRENETAAGCETAGSYETVVRCMECGEELSRKTDAVPATGHQYGQWTTKDDTTHQRVCKHDSSHVETAEHTWNTGEITKPLTPTENGEKTYKCIVCGAEKKEEIIATAVDVTAWINALPESLTAGDEAKVNNVLAALEGLTEDQTKRIPEETILNAEDAKVVMSVIKAIEGSDTGNPDSVEKAEAAYKALSETQKKKMSEAEKQTLGDKVKAAETAKAINSLDVSDPASVEEARKLYDSLTEDQKKLIDAEIFTKLSKAEEEVKAKTKKVLVSGIKLSGISNNIAAGKKTTLTATVTPKNAAKKTLKWTSGNTKVATVNQSGQVTINKKAGGKTVKIFAAATDGSGKQAVFTIKVMKGAVTKVTVKGAKKTLKVGKIMKLKAKVKVSKGKPVNKKLKWTSSNPKYATVSATGKVKALQAGKGKKVKITAMATDGSGKKKTVTIKIK